MTAEELLRRYAAGERDFKGAKLKNLDFGNVDLSDINFTNTSINNVKFDGTNLSRVILDRAKIASTHFFMTNLQEANLREVNMFGVYVEKANLKKVRIADSSFIECTFEEVNLEQAFIKNNLWGDTTRFSDVNLKKAIWQEIDEYPLRRDTIMPDGEIVTDMIELPDGSKIFP